MKQHIYKQEYLAEPQSHEGPVYPEFTPEIHVVPPFNITGARLFRSIGWGIQAPCVCLWAALMPGGEIYIYREYYAKNWFWKLWQSACEAFRLTTFENPFLSASEKEIAQEQTNSLISEVIKLKRTF